MAEAREHYLAATRAAPAYAAAQLDLGSVLEVLGDRDGARRAFEAARAGSPEDPYAAYNLGRLLFVGGELPRAESLLRTALHGKPDFPEALVALAGVLEARDDLTGALGALEASLALRPGYAGAQKNAGMLLGRLERWPEAASALRRAAELDAADADALLRLGDAQMKLDEPGLALEAYRGATARRADFAEAWCRQGNVLADRGSRDEALACFSRALESKPDYADAYLGLGNAYGAVARLEDAAEQFRRALAVDPRHALAHLNLGIALSGQGRQAEALDSFRTALALDPDWPEARWAYAIAQVPTMRSAGDDLPGVRRRIAGALEELVGWFDEHPGTPGAYRAVGVQQPFWLAYQEEDNRPLLESYGRLCARLMGDWQARHRPHSVPTRRSGPVRVGVVSPHFRHHSVWHAIVRGWFARLDPARVTLIAFSLDPQEDDETRFARSRAARFEQGHIGLGRWCEVIADAQPDVLVYPEIGMDPMSLRLASLRLARLQAACWGHPETTGLPTIDCYLSAEGMEPEGAAAHYSERLVALPHLGCWLEERPVDATPAARARWGIERDAPLLVSPGTPFKYAPEHDWVFAEIARRLGRCRLLFFRHRVRALDERLEARLRAAFAARGLAFEQYASFLPWQAPGAFHGLLRSADLYLDTIGFSGFNTALQALQCDLPVVTVEGRFLRGRLASGMLRRLALDELVAAGPEQYVELAVRLAGDAGQREALRARLRAARRLLFGDPEPIRALERFLAQGV